MRYTRWIVMLCVLEAGWALVGCRSRTVTQGMLTGQNAPPTRLVQVGDVAVPAPVGWQQKISVTPAKLRHYIRHGRAFSFTIPYQKDAEWTTHIDGHEASLSLELMRFPMAPKPGDFAKGTAAARKVIGISDSFDGTETKILQSEPKTVLGHPGYIDHTLRTRDGQYPSTDDTTNIMFAEGKDVYTVYGRVSGDDMDETTKSKFRNAWQHFVKGLRKST